jgi:hypothetical protein
MRIDKRVAWIAIPLLWSLSGGAQTASACSFGSPFGGEASLQSTLNGMLATAPDVTTACLADGTAPGGDAHWVAVSPTSATVLLEIAGYANLNRFGLYDAANPGTSIEIFSGPNGPGTQAQLVFTPESGGIRVSVTVGETTWSSGSLFMSSTLGFYLLTPDGNTFYSNSALNAGGADQMYAYRGNGSAFTSGPVAGTFFGGTDAILAYEDLLKPGGDGDHQDFVVLVRGVQPVPLPAGALLLASGLGSLWGLQRRRGRTRRPRASPM